MIYESDTHPRRANRCKLKPAKDSMFISKKKEENCHDIKILAWKGVNRHASIHEYFSCYILKKSQDHLQWIGGKEEKASIKNCTCDS